MARCSQRLDNQAQLFLFIISSKKGIAETQLCDQTAETPHIYGRTILCPKDYLWSSIKARLNVSVVSLVQEHACSEINQLDSYFFPLFHKNILWL